MQRYANRPSAIDVTCYSCNAMHPGNISIEHPLLGCCESVIARKEKYAFSRVAYID